MLKVVADESAQDETDGRTLLATRIRLRCSA
jgi:hypothetical protein